MTNRERFQVELEKAYQDLFATNPEYAYTRDRISLENLAIRMTAGLANGSANKDGDGIKRACKACGIKQTYKAIREYLNG